MNASWTRSLLLPAFALSLAACESTGPDGSRTEIRITQGAAASASIAPALIADFAATTAAGAPVALGNVAAIEVAVTSVRALPAAADTTDAGSSRWVSLDVTAPATLNLVALPSSSETGVSLAREELPAGSYQGVVVSFSSATITFKEPVTVGQQTYPANQKINLVIPSKRIFFRTTGFTIGEDAGAEVKLVFDASASVKNVVASGSGAVRMNPVVGANVKKGS